MRKIFNSTEMQLQLYLAVGQIVLELSFGRIVSNFWSNCTKMELWLYPPIGRIILPSFWSNWIKFLVQLYQIDEFNQLLVQLKKLHCLLYPPIGPIVQNRWSNCTQVMVQIRKLQPILYWTAGPVVLYCVIGPVCVVFWCRLSDLG